MPDLYFKETGDVAVSPSGDLALTPTNWRSDAQQAYIRTLTEQGDYLLYENLGASLSRLYGMPQSQKTGNVGIELIRAALDREGVFLGKPCTIKAIPIGPQKIRFDINIVSGSQEQILLSVEQDLGLS